MSRSEPDLAPFFSAEDLEAIRDAAASAETGSSGEIVTYVVARCDEYEEARWKGAAVGALTAAVVAGLAHDYLHIWGGSGVLWVALPAFAGAALGYLLAWFVPAVARALIPVSVLRSRVARRAEAAFLEEEVFHTRDRTGILVFLALFEHRAVVLCDAGINAVVGQSAWDGIVADLTRGIAEGKPTDAVLAAIGRCAAILAEHRVARRPDDVNELADDVRVRKR